MKLYEQKWHLTTHTKDNLCTIYQGDNIIMEGVGVSDAFIVVTKHNKIVQELYDAINKFGNSYA